MTDPTPFTPFDESGGLILAVRLPGSAVEFGDQRRGWERLGASESGGPLWVHLDRTKERAQRWLRSESGLDPVVAESLLAEETRPRAQAFGDGLLVILRGIITLRQHRFATVAEIRARAQAGKAPATAGAFVTAVAAGLTTRMGPSILNLEEMLDDIEEEMLEKDSDDEGRRSQLATIRRQAIAYRRHLVPQRDALGALVNGPQTLLSARDQVELRVWQEQTTRACEALEELRDRAAVTQEEMRARHEARVGRTVYLLTIVATVMLPLGFLTGLLGINVGGLPLAGSPWGFAIVCVLLAGLAALQVVWFRKKRWL
jgi:zinc transporter